MCARWIAHARLLTHPEIGYRRPSRPCSATRFKNVIFALPIAKRASKVLGPISGHHVAQMLPLIRSAARASRPRLAVGILRVLRIGMCTAKRFHVDNEVETCRVGGSNEL